MKTPDPTKAESSAPNSANFIPAVTLTKRQGRLLQALLIADTWIWREEVDRIAGASNGPQIIAELRQKVTGHDGIEMRQVDAADRDGKPCRPGQYRLSEVGRERTSAHFQFDGMACNG